MPVIPMGSEGDGRPEGAFETELGLEALCDEVEEAENGDTKRVPKTYQKS